MCQKRVQRTLRLTRSLNEVAERAALQHLVLQTVDVVLELGKDRAMYPGFELDLLGTCQ